MYHKSDGPTFHSGWTSTATRITLHSKQHLLMMNGVATGTLVSTSIIEWLVAFTLGLAVTRSGTWLVTTGCPADVAILMVRIFGGLKGLTRVSGRVWSESACSIDMLFWFLLLTLGEWQPGKSSSLPCIGGQNFTDDRNPLHLNTFINNYSSN